MRCGLSGSWTLDHAPAVFSGPSALLDTGIHIAFDGRLDNRDELLRDLPAAADGPTLADGDLAGAVYQAFGVDFATRLKGDFALALFDPRHRHLVLARDAIGVRPLYYRHTPHALHFASDIKTLLRASGERARPNDTLLAQMMLNQLHRHDDAGSTFFEGINSVPASHMAIASARGVSVRRYWDFPMPRIERRKTFDEYADGFRHHFGEAVTRRMRGASVAVSVSGGLDSSSIFCIAAAASPHSVTGLTYSTRDGSASDESRYISEIERHTNLRVQFIEPPPAHSMLHRATELIRTIEQPMLNPEWHRGEHLVAEAKRRGASMLMTGHFGDQMTFDQAYLVDLLNRGAWPSVHAHVSEYPQWFEGTSRREFIARLFADLMEYDLPKPARALMRAVRAPFRQPPAWDWYSSRFQQCAGPDVFAHEPPRAAFPNAMARAIYREVRSRYHALCLDWHYKVGAHLGIDRAFPFLDRDLIEFVMTVPGEMLARGGVPKALLRSAMAGVVPAAVLGRRGKGDFTETVNDTARRDHAAAAEMLGPDSLVVQMRYVDADKLKRGVATVLADLHGSDSCSASWRLSAVLALELWLREFIGQEQPIRRT